MGAAALASAAFRLGSASPAATADISDKAVTLAKMADLATARIVGRATAGTGVPEALTAAQARTVLGLGVADSPALTAETLTAGAAAAAVALRVGASATEGLEWKVIDEQVVLTNAASSPLTAGAIPAGAVVLSVQANLDSAVVGDGSGDALLAKVGVGISSSKAKYGASGTLAKNQKIDTIPAHAVNAGETVILYGLKADGATACTEKFTAGGLVRVRIVYAAPNSLDDHA